MDKNAIKKYAVWARTELLTRVSQRAEKYDITAEADASASSVNGVLLSDAEIKQRKALIEQVKQKGFDQVMEEVAYTWFNRFIALRFMEVNGYLPSHIRVFTDDNNNFKPQILAEAIHLELDGLDMEKVYELKNNNQNDELYKYLIMTQCYNLGEPLPRMFPKKSLNDTDYSLMLFPDNILREGSVIEQMITLIPEEDWKNQVQIIGWLYQYYNTDPKAKVFGKPKGSKIEKYEIPAATQLFTPDWIVRYMVENSLGKLWAEGHEDTEKKASWTYYVEDEKQDDTVKALLQNTSEKRRSLKPEEIKCIDPCSGSGHVLTYLFDVLIQIYEDYGISNRDAVRSIIENNLWGLDIDERASQLAYFSVMMKGVQYDRRFLNRRDENGKIVVPQPSVIAVKESNGLDRDVVDYFCGENEQLKGQLNLIIRELNDAKDYGSLIQVSLDDYDQIFKRFDELKDDISFYHERIMSDLLPLIMTAKALSQKYDVTVTNPPYMSLSSANAKLYDYTKEKYPDSKTDLYSVFIERCIQFTKKDSYVAMITMHSWMFLSSFEKLRKKVLNESIINMVHLGARAFEEIGGEVVQTVAFCLKMTDLDCYRGKYYRLLSANSQDEKEKAFLEGNNTYYADQSEFSQIEGSPIAYWISENLLKDFSLGTKLKKYGDTRQGMATSDNNRFLRLWYEVDFNKIGFGCKNADEAVTVKKKWYPYNKGGSYRKWYGNIDYLVNYENDGAEVKGYAASKYKSATRTIKSISEYFKPCLSWSKVSTGSIAFRYYPEGFIFDVAGCCIFYKDLNKMYYDFGFINSNVAMSILEILAPTMNFEAGHVATLPVIESYDKQAEVIKLVTENVQLSKEEWDCYETSWDFKQHPLVNKAFHRISDAFEAWSKSCDERFEKERQNEERLNQIFIDIYGLSNELSSEVQESSISLRKAEKGRDIKSLISYAVGCMFGRYSLDQCGVVYAGGEWDASPYKTFGADEDGIIPICDDEYFDDDLTGRFVSFIDIVYGHEFLEENLTYIATALGGTGSSREVLRNYFLNDFYADHCSTYSVNGSGKRPIYWLFDSGKKNGFKCLVYMHRFKNDTMARIRTDYVHEQQARYRTAIEEIENRILSASNSDKVKLNKKLNSLKDQDEELHLYEEKVHHLADKMITIDLDNGFKENYALFSDVVAKV